MCSLIYVFYHWILRIISIRILLKVESDWCIRKYILLKNAWDVVQELEESQIIYTLAPGAKILNFCNKRPAGLIVKIESAIKMWYNSYNHTIYQIKLIFQKQNTLILFFFSYFGRSSMFIYHKRFELLRCWHKLHRKV